MNDHDNKGQRCINTGKVLIGCAYQRPHAYYLRYMNDNNRFWQSVFLGEFARRRAQRWRYARNAAIYAASLFVLTMWVLEVVR